MSARFSSFLSGLLLVGAVWGQDLVPGNVEQSYHGLLGQGTGLGMLEKWCALPNFSFEQQGGIEGWIEQPCVQCHVGAPWNPDLPSANCDLCHTSKLTGDRFTRPTVASCMTCHKKDTEKRGDLFTAATDVHVETGLLCQDCHLRTTDPRGWSDHQFAKGTPLDTTEPTMKGTLSCATCHLDPHAKLAHGGPRIDAHLDKVACETCHTGARPGWALASRQWNVFTAAGTPVSVKRDPGFLPVYKWYDNLGAGAAGDYRLPILGVTERRNAPGAKIYPFNPITVTWFVKTEVSPLDDVIVVPEVKAADADGDGTVTVAEMRTDYPRATLVTRDMTFSISHSVRPASQAYRCHDCHGRRGWVLDWKALGYSGDPRQR